MVGGTGRSGVRRRVFGALAPMLVVGALVPAAAQAGTVGVTGTIKGAGSMESVEGGPYSCSKTNGYNDNAESSCTRAAFGAPFEAWVWLKPTPANFPDGDSEWRFSHWEGCDQTRPKTGGLTECAVHSGSFSADERRPKAVFYDSRNPTVQIDSGPTASTRTKEKSATFTFSSPNDTLATFKCKLDGAATYTDCTSGKSYTGLSEGSHTFRVYAVDPSGNATPTDAIRTWTIDSVGPSVSFTGGHGAGAVTNNRNAQFTFTASEPSQFWCKFEELTPGPKSTAVFSACSGTGATTGASPMYFSSSDGAYSFSVYANDGLQNGPTLSRSWTVDTVAPDTTLSGGPPALTNSTSASFTFSSEPGATFECSLDDAPYTSAACADADALTVGHGAHRFRVRARDAAGNLGPPDFHQWTVDTEAPEATITAGPSGTTTDTSATFAFSSGEAGGSFECTIDGGAPSECSSPTSFTALPVGGHVFTVTPQDAAGNTGATVVRTWSIQAPAANPQQNTTGTGTVTGSDVGTGNSTVDGKEDGASRGGGTSSATTIAGPSSLKARPDKKGRFTLKGVGVTCPAGCVVKIVAKAGKKTLAKLAFTGGRQAVRLRLTKKGGALLKRKRKVTLKVAIAVTPASGTPAKKTLKVALRR